MGRFFTASGLLLAIALLSGCGGSGGGGVRTLTYKTDWTNAVSASGGQSERVQLFDSTGALINSVVMNATTGLATNPFTGLTGNLYHLQVQLFSGTDATGTEVGDFDALVNPGATPTVQTAVGDAVNSIVVTPTSATVNVQQSQQFYVGGYYSSTVGTFVAPGSITWSVLGGVGTIDPSAGLFLGTTPGSGSVRATYGPTSLTGGATVTVNSINVTKSTWTIMVYMNAANDLSPYSLLNFNQMESAVGNPNVRVVVQWKQVTSLPYSAAFNGTRRYLVTHDTTDAIASQLVQDMGTGIDMGNYQTMNDFINWTKTYYPADHYCLIVWDHGNGWHRTAQPASTRGVSYDDEFGTSIQTWQLSQAIGNNHLDILAWDASLMQMAEVADEIRDKVDYIAGSEESPPGAGYPYNLVINTFNANPNDTPRNLSDAFVNAMVQGYANDGADKITQSVLDTSQLPALNTAVAQLGQALSANVSSLGTAVPNARNNAQSYSQTSIRYYRDLYDLTLQLDTQTSIAAVNQADAAVRAAVKNAVVWEGHNSLSPNSHGISIDFSPSSVYQSYSSDYQQLRFNTDTNWGSWLSLAP